MVKRAESNHESERRPQGPHPSACVHKRDGAARPGELEVPITIGARRAGSSACRGTRHASAALQVGKSGPRVAWAGPTRSIAFRSGVFLLLAVVFQWRFPQCVVARLVVLRGADDKIPCYVFNIIPPERLVDAYSYMSARPADHSDATGRTPGYTRVPLTLTSRVDVGRPASVYRGRASAPTAGSALSAGVRRLPVTTHVHV